MFTFVLNVGISGEIGVCVARNSEWERSLKTIDLNYVEGLFFFFYL